MLLAVRVVVLGGISRRHTRPQRPATCHFTSRDVSRSNACSSTLRRGRRDEPPRRAPLPPERILGASPETTPAPIRPWWVTSRDGRVPGLLLEWRQTKSG